jgi:hypothetical protein
VSRGAVSLLALAALGLMGVACAVDFPDYELEGGGTTGNGGAGGAETLAADGAPCSTHDECVHGHCLPTDSEQASVCCATDCEVTSTDSCGTTGNCNADGASCALYPSGTICGGTTCADGILATDRCEAGSCTPGGAVDESFEGTLRYQIKLTENGNNPQPGIMAKRCDAGDPQCASPLEDVSVLQTGDISATVPADFFGYLDISGGGYKPTLVYLGPPNHLPTPIERVPVFNASLFNFLLSGVGLDQEEAGRGHLFILGADCEMEPAAGLTFTATTADDDSEGFYYTSSGAVSDDALATSELGIGGFINVPAGEVIVRVSRAEDTSTPMGEATVTIRPQTITILRLGPTP